MRSILWAVVGLLSVSVGASAAGAADPRFPLPGGGPVAIHAYEDPLGERPRVWLLHTATGNYTELPFASATVTPDGGWVAVVRDDGSGLPTVGVARRHDLQRHGEQAVRWTGLPNSGIAQFSPDGAALMTYELDKGQDTIAFVIHRLDLADGRVTTTRTPQLQVTGIPYWSADSSRYLLNIADPEAPDGPGRVFLLDFDGTVGALMTQEGGVVRQYSPSRRHVIIDPGLPFSNGIPADWKIAKVVDVHTGRIVNRIPSATVHFGVPTTSPLLGWYDETHVVRYAPDAACTTIEVVDIFTLAVVQRVPAPGLQPLSYVDLRPTGLLTGRAKRAGF